VNSGPFIYSKNDIQKIINTILIILVPLILYGFYKNGIIPMTKEYGNVFDLLKPLLIPLIGFSIGYGIKKLRKNKSFVFLPLYGLLAGMASPVSINYFMFIIICSLVLGIITYLPQKISFNRSAIIILVILVISTLLKNYSYMNLYEVNVEVAYSFVDVIVGRNFSGMATSSILLVVIGYVYLSFNDKYKSDIPIYILGSYIIFAIIGIFISNGFENFISKVFNGYLFFSVVFIATDNASSPYTKMGRVLYGVATGICIFIFSLFINLNIAVFLAVVLTSIFKPVFDKTYEIYLN